MLGKRGQFFLVAALVISGILIGLASVYTEISAPDENLAVYDLSSELNYESLQVIDQGVYTGLSQDELNANILNLTDYYVEKDPKSEFVIVYGDEDSIKVREYKPSDAGNIGVDTGGRKITETIFTRSTEDHDGDRIGDNIVVRVGNNSLSLNLRLGQQFYTVVKRHERNQTYVAVGGR